MPRPANPLETVKSLLVRNHDERAIALTATTLWDYSEQGARKLIYQAKRSLGREAERMDLLGELMRNYHCQGTVIDMMTRTLKEEPQNAHFYNTLRHCQKDRTHTLTLIDNHREKAARNKFQESKNKAKESVEVERKTAIHFAACETYRKCGFWVHPTLGAMQPGIHLNAEEVAERDIIRLRVLPKSPKEDYILGEIMQAVIQEEKELEAQKQRIDSKEYQTDIRILDPQEFAEEKERFRTSITHREQSLIAQRVFIARLQAYNETWAKAEEKVTGIMEALGIKLGFRHESIGLPAVVQNAADGDEQAIAELKEVVANHLKVKEQKLGQEKQRFSDYVAKSFLTPAREAFLALLIAFACSWTCVNLVVGNIGLQTFLCAVHMAEVQPAEAVAGVNGTPFPPGSVAGTSTLADSRTENLTSSSRGQWSTTDPCHGGWACFFGVFTATG